MARGIQRVAVLGAGVMGSGIAAHLANAGIPSYLFDIVPEGAGDDPAARNGRATAGLQAAVKAKPAAFMNRADAALVTPANMDDHGELLAECDWIVEVVVERLDIKKSVFEWVAKHRKPGTIVSSNTSGIPLADMAAAMPDEMREHFLITHFFNPVRYLRLLEIVSGPDTSPTVTAQMAAFGERVLGKGIVYGKDTPNFVGNRIGTFLFASLFQHLPNTDLTIEEIDTIFGSTMGRAKSAVFRTADVVGLDTLAHVFGTAHAKCEGDEKRDWYEVPAPIAKLVEEGRLGQKAGAGFYKKIKEKGKSVILGVDLDTLEYRPASKRKFASVGKAKKQSTVEKKVATLIWGDDAAAEIAWKVTADTLIYAANRIPEIADDIVQIDRALEWGFGNELGPFQTWDAIGVAKSVERMQGEGLEVPKWVLDMLAAGRDSFYARDDAGRLTFWGIDGAAHPVPVLEGAVFLPELKTAGKELAKNPSASLVDLGDGVLGLEFHSKVNALDNLIFEMAAKGLDHLDAGDFDAMVVGNQDGKAFSAGANILGILMASMQGDFATIDAQISELQQLMMRMKYSAKPVVTAPYGLALGGGAEVAMHGSAAVASGELYMGLVEGGVGLIPAGGGCKELLVRYLGDAPQKVDYDPNPAVQTIFETIAMAKVSTSAEEARLAGMLRPTDKVVLNPDLLLGEAKRMARGLADAGYVPPRRRTVKLPGAQGRAALEIALFQMNKGGFATDHDVVVGKKLANVLTGGDIPSGTEVTEQHLLDLEREAFLSLCGEPKTLARIQHMLQTNKPLRN